MMAASTIDTGEWLYLRIYQRTSSTATSAGSYVVVYFPPQVQVSSSFNTSYDCQFQWNQNSCDITFNRTATYLKVTIKAIGSFATSYPNPFEYNVRRYIMLRNLLFP